MTGYSLSSLVGDEKTISRFNWISVGIPTKYFDFTIISFFNKSAALSVEVNNPGPKIRQNKLRKPANQNFLRWSSRIGRPIGSTNPETFSILSSTIGYSQTFQEHLPNSQKDHLITIILKNFNWVLHFFCFSFFVWEGGGERFSLIFITFWDCLQWFCSSTKWTFSRRRWSLQIYQDTSQNSSKINS